MTRGALSKRRAADDERARAAICSGQTPFMPVCLPFDSRTSDRNGRTGVRRARTAVYTADQCFDREFWGPTGVRPQNSLAFGEICPPVPFLSRYTQASLGVEGSQEAGKLCAPPPGFSRGR